MLLCLFALILCIIFTEAAVKKVSRDEKSSGYWLVEGLTDIHRQILQTNNQHVAKNVILFIGDGMGPATVSAARNYKNQQMVKETSPDVGLFFEGFPNTALMKTHSTDAYVADSSSTATAMVTGVKTNSGVVSVGPEVIFDNCSSHELSYDLESIATMFRKLNKSVGIVTTTRITHATPSVMYAHSASRNWESSVPQGCLKKDIAYQLIGKSKFFEVILGGGLDRFLPISEGGKRTDDKNLINWWRTKMGNTKSTFVTNRTDFLNVNLRDVNYLFGLFALDHLDFDAQRTDQPSLEEMTETAIKVLSKNKNGFFLMVEGGRIDHAHHQNRAKLAILETLALEKAVRKGVSMTNTLETLISVTADHSHVFTMGSYVKRENDITKKNLVLSGQERDGRGHTSFLYSNGPGFRTPRQNITDLTEFVVDFQYNSAVPLNSETHGGEEVAIYSQGPWSHLFNGVHHQSYVGHVMMYASCSGPYVDRPLCSGTAMFHNIFTPLRVLIIALMVKVIIHKF